MPTTLASPELSITTVRTLAIDARRGTPTAAIPGRRWGSRRRRGPLFTRHCATTRPTRSGRTATASCCRPGTRSMLLYALLHLTGYDLPIDELKRFRQWGSADAGPPGARRTRRASRSPPGRSARASPTPSASRWPSAMLAARFNRTGHEIVDHRTWFICSDGDLMEGISHEAASIAGHLGLEKLIGIYDDNQISLDGPTSLAFAEDVPAPLRGLRLARAAAWTTATTSRRSTRPSPRRRARRPADADRAAARTSATASPNKQDTSSAHGVAARARGGRRRPRRPTAGPRTRTSSCPTRSPPGRRRWSRAGGRSQAEWDGAHARPTRAAEPAERAPSCAGACAGGLPDGWRMRPPRSTAGEQARDARVGGQGDERRSPRSSRSWCRARPTSPPPPHRPQGHAAIVAPGDFAGRNIYFGVREHAMGGDHERARRPRRPAAGLRRRSSRSPTT